MQDPIRIAGKEYKFVDMPMDAQKMVGYITTIDKNLDSLQTQMDMMQITRDGCYTRLNNALESEDATQETDTPEGGLQKDADA